MFTYSIIKHEDTENGTLYALYETTQDDDGETMVMGNAPVNGVFYESMDELVEHHEDIYQYIQQVARGEKPVIDAENATFVDLEGEDCCDEGCECEGGCGCEAGCGCESKDGEWKSFQEEGKEEGQGNSEMGGMKKGCCGGGCCNHEHQKHQ
jgi:hypothetical protein